MSRKSTSNLRRLSAIVNERKVNSTLRDIKPGSRRQALLTAVLEEAQARRA